VVPIHFNEYGFICLVNNSRAVLGGHPERLALYDVDGQHVRAPCSWKHGSYAALSHNHVHHVNNFVQTPSSQSGTSPRNRINSLPSASKSRFPIPSSEFFTMIFCPVSSGASSSPIIRGSPPVPWEGSGKAMPREEEDGWWITVNCAGLRTGAPVLYVRSSSWSGEGRRHTS
jgi:hypothetical protein